MHSITSLRSRALVPALVAIALIGACSSDERGGATDATGGPTTEPITEATPLPEDTGQIVPETTATMETTAEVPASTAGDPAVSTAPADDADAIAATRAVFAAITPDLPGCTFAASRDGEVVYGEAFGAARLDPFEPMTNATVVDIGSTSKQFTATALLLLAERGQVDLDASLSTYLPDLPSWADEPTMRQVMHHQSGIPDYINLLAGRGFSITDVTTDADALAALGDVGTLEFVPGTSWAYSNSNYFLIGQVVRALTGDDLGTFLLREVFTPLGLDMVMDPTAIITAKAVSYDGSSGAFIVADSPWQQLGDGAIQTTPSQLVRWAKEYWAPVIGRPTINDDRLDRAPTVADVPGGGVYGAGIFASEVDGIGTVLRHSGGWGGFVTVFAVAPARRVAIAGTCTSPDAAGKLDGGADAELELLRIWTATS